jgi:hypothetical protein
MSYQVGSTVVAIRDGDESVLNIFGEGVYVGDLPREDTSVIPADIRELIEMRIATDDAYPIYEHPLVKLHDSFVDNLQETPEDLAKVVAMVQEDRAKPFEQRVTMFYEEMMRNPCIYLDSGDIVWGAQCWWGPRDETLQRFARAQINTVPVPEGNGRWK